MVGTLDHKVELLDLRTGMRLWRRKGMGAHLSWIMVGCGLG